MKDFRELLLLEALRIVKKKSDQPMETTIPTEPVIQKLSKSEEKRLVGEPNEIPNTFIIKSTHATEVRQGERFPRDYRVRDAVIVRTLKKAHKKGFNQKSGISMITYKNKDKKYDVMVCHWIKNKIIIITMIQAGKESPNQFFSGKHKNKTRFMVEKEIISISHLDINTIIIID